jgi:serine/threonine protein kinase
LAELIGRKPLFPGRDSFHQITLITSIIGTPPHEDTHINSTSSANNNGTSTHLKADNNSVCDFVSALPKKPKIPFQQLFPKANPLACDLLDKLLCFDPDKRLTVEQALKHSYLVCIDTIQYSYSYPHS